MAQARDIRTNVTNPTEGTSYLASYLLLALESAVKAGEKILAIYETDFDSWEKSNRTLVTDADLQASEVIVSLLKQTGYPVISEEGEQIPFEERRSWGIYWLIDPLDGTREFVAKRDHFTVNISLMVHSEPIFGLIYSPVFNRVWFAAEKEGAFRLEDVSIQLNKPFGQVMGKADRIPDTQTDRFTVMVSQSHISQRVESYIKLLEEEHGEIALLRMGSAEKLCRVAEGSGQIYPRFGPTMEWDTAAGQIILTECGKNIYHHQSGEPLRYNKADLANPWFIAR